jgi:hypothetical protein
MRVADAALLSFLVQNGDAYDFLSLQQHRHSCFKELNTVCLVAARCVLT